MHTVILVVHLLIVLALIGLVLLQRSEGGGLGMGSGGGFMTTRGTTNVLSRTTGILAAAFFATSLVLSIIAGFDRKPSSILNTGAPVTVPGGAPTVPLGSGSGGVLDALKQQGQPPAAPQPSGPQVPQSQ
jgi:preprotein translocase subunit SecG